MLFHSSKFDAALGRGAQPVALFRETLDTAARTLEERFRAGTAASALVHARTSLIDQLILRAWDRFFTAGGPDIALLAVGGYGRGEMHPHSDVDILILTRDTAPEGYRDAIEKFLAFLWDVGLPIAHSARSLAECAVEAERDVTVATNVMEARLLAGPNSLFEALRDALGPERMWPSREFFAAKRKEQAARHAKFHDTAYRLEPNVKESPGGLRDIQTIGWVAKRHFGAETLHDLVDHGFLTEAEYASLMEGQEFLWKIRFALHGLTRRREDRLLFDHQTVLAKRFGYADADHNLAVEQFMKQYYRTVKDLSALNEMLLQLFEEAIVYADDPAEPVPINRRFQARRGFLETVRPDVFSRYPHALLEVFLVMAQRPELKGVRAETLRQVRAHLPLIDERFRADLRARSLFMELLRQPRGITHELRRMNRHGVLGAYLPEFGAIVGLMQYDLFHVYTVDEHTLMVVRNVRRLSVAQFRHEFPHCSQIFDRVPKPELLYLAALFHDIAKGRSGDHSSLGASDARRFCERHGLSSHDGALVAWLVENHLLMSTTVQRRDISEPAVINDFAAAVRDRVRLDYLYLLTVSDIRATNPSIWNSWKDALLTELYQSATRALRRGLEQPLDEAERIRGVQAMARADLKNRGVASLAAVDGIWAELGKDYFLRHQADEIVWHTEAIALTPPEDLPLVLVRHSPQRGSTSLFLYARDHNHLFPIVTAALDQLGLTIVDARIISSRSGWTLDTYAVLEADGEPIASPARVQAIQTTVRERLRRPEDQSTAVARRVPRQFRYFPIPTTIEFSLDEHYQRTVMELVTGDRPGLLARVGQAFQHCNVRLQNAKIATFGSRAEDIFFLTDEENRPIQRTETLDCLRATLQLMLAEG